MKNIICTKIAFIFVCGFLFLLASCTSNTSQSLEDDPMYQALLHPTPGAIVRPPSSEALTSQDAPANQNSVALQQPQMLPNGMTILDSSPGEIPSNQDSTMPQQSRDMPPPQQGLSMPMPPFPPESSPTQAMQQNQNFVPPPPPTSPMPQRDFAPQGQVFPRVIQAEPEPDFDFSQIDCNIDEDGINEIVAEVKKRRHEVIETLPNCLKLNRKLMLRASIINPNEFQFASDILKEDESFVRRMIEINPGVLKFAASSLHSDSSFMEGATYLNRDALQYAHPKLLNNKIFMRRMIDMDAKNYIFASERLKELPEFAESAFKDNGMLLEYAPQKIKSDKKLVTIAVKSNADALQYASLELREDKLLKKLATKKSTLSPDDLKKFLRDNYVDDSNKKHVGFVFGNRMKYFSDNGVIDRNYVTKWQRRYDYRKDDTAARLITADSRNYQSLWKDDFADFPLLIKKIEKFFLNHNVDKNTIDNLSTVYLYDVKDRPETVVFNLYLLRDSKDFELGPKFSNVTSLTAIAQRHGNKWDLSVVEVIFDSEMKIDLAYESGHKKYILWDLYLANKKDKNPKIIFKVEDKFREYFEIFEEQNNGKYRMAQQVDSLKDALAEDKKPAKIVEEADSF